MTVETKNWENAQFRSGVGRFLVNMYKNKNIALREGISNSCDAIRIKEQNIRKIIDEKINAQEVIKLNERPDIIKLRDRLDIMKNNERVIKIYINNPDRSSRKMDVGIGDWGTGVLNLPEFKGSGPKEVPIVNDPLADDVNIGQYGQGKNSFLGLSDRDVPLVEYYSRTDEEHGMILRHILNKKGDLQWENPPEERKGSDVLNHIGLLVLIKDVSRQFTTKMLKQLISRWFFLKITRGYKIFIHDRITGKEEPVYLCDSSVQHNTANESVLFTLDNGTPVRGSIKHAKKLSEGRRKEGKGNIDICVSNVFIETKDFEYEAEGYISVNDNRLVDGLKEGIRTDEEFSYPEIADKLRQWLIDNKFTKRSQKNYDLKNERQLEKMVLEEQVKYLEAFRDKTSPFPQIKIINQGVNAGDTNSKWQKGTLIIDPNGNVGHTKRGKRGPIKKRGGRIKKKPVKHYTYHIEKGGKTVKLDKMSSGETDQSKPDIKITPIGLGMDEPQVRIRSGRLVINTSRKASYIFSHLSENNRAVRNEFARAIILATPENQAMSLEEFNKEYNIMMDSAFN